MGRNEEIMRSNKKKTATMKIDVETLTMTFINVVSRRTQQTHNFYFEDEEHTLTQLRLILWQCLMSNACMHINVTKAKTGHGGDVCSCNGRNVANEFGSLNRLSLAIHAHAINTFEIGFEWPQQRKEEKKNEKK